MANYDFVRDLAVAKKTEERVSRLLEKKYNAKILEFSENGKYDILTQIKELPVSFEVKEDFMCAKTGNVALEFECRGKLSGINVTEADHHVYVIRRHGGETVYVLFKTSVLKEKIRAQKYFRIVSGGDPGSNTKNYLFKYDVFIQDGVIMEIE